MGLAALEPAHAASRSSVRSSKQKKSLDAFFFFLVIMMTDDSGQGIHINILKGINDVSAKKRQSLPRFYPYNSHT